MERRKIQLVAGTTYSVSLPKSWVLRHGLKEQKEVTVAELADGSLKIAPDALQAEPLGHVRLDAERYGRDIEQVLFAAFYAGAESITVKSKTALPQEMRMRVRRALGAMSGTEIVMDDESRIEIAVFLDRSRLNLHQLLYRISLLVESSLDAILNGLRIEEVRMNEDEVDRLYHLVSKLITLALMDSSVLASSGIRQLSQVPAYFLIAKRLENIEDSLSYLSEYLHEKGQKFERKEIFSAIERELRRSIRFLLKQDTSLFEKCTREELARMRSLAQQSKDVRVQGYLLEIVRFVADIEEEIVNISFYGQLLGKKERKDQSLI